MTTYVKCPAAMEEDAAEFEAERKEREEWENGGAATPGTKVNVPDRLVFLSPEGLKIRGAD